MHPRGMRLSRYVSDSFGIETKKVRATRTIDFKVDGTWKVIRAMGNMEMVHETGKRLISRAVCRWKCFRFLAAHSFVRVFINSAGALCLLDEVILLSKRCETRWKSYRASDGNSGGAVLVPLSSDSRICNNSVDS